MTFFGQIEYSSLHSTASYNTLSEEETRQKSIYDSLMSRCVPGQSKETIADLWIAYLTNGGNLHELQGTPHLLTAFKGLVHFRCFDGELDKFSYLIELLLQKGADINLSFKEIKLCGSVLTNATPLHVLYLYWKNQEWSEYQVEIFERLFDRLLEEPCLDLRATFSEEYTNRNESDNIFYDWEFDGNVSDLLEEANILHYAAYLGDNITLYKLLARDPELIHSSCQTVAGKNMLTHFKFFNSKIYRVLVFSQELNRINSKVPGILASASTTSDCDAFDIERTCRVTALHIAAKKLNISTTHLLIGQGASLGALDSSNHTVQACTEVRLFNLDAKEITRERREFLKSLKFVPQLPRQLPQAQLMLHKRDFSVLLDNRTKVPVYVYERLSRENLPSTSEMRPNYFCQDNEVPALNRALTTDYIHSGYDRGHLRAAANASGESKKATFTMSNVFPQNHTVNLTYWKQLEQGVRNLTQQCDFLEVFTGVIYAPQGFQDGKRGVCYEVIGQGDVAVPTHAYKVIYMHLNQKIEELAYVVPNQATSGIIQTTVQEVQKLSGVMFHTMS